MQFSTLPFLVYFLPVTLLLHLILPLRAQNAFLLLASAVAYAWGDIRHVPLILLSMLLNYGCGLGCGSGRRGMRIFSLGFSLTVNLGMLIYFKYAGFFLTAAGLGGIAPEIALPLGISFYTFQAQAYVVDVYRKATAPERNVVDYGAFMLMFPRLVAGPIIQYADVRREMKQRKMTAAGLEGGMMEFVAGLSAKVLLANPLGGLWKTAREMPGASSAALWLGIVAFGLQIYFDFGGYSLMAMGIGKMLGFRFPENFRHPYAARSIKEFWQRWHITLGNWFRNYVHLPLGGALVKRKWGMYASYALSTLAVWFLTGLWHGAGWNFVAWGLWFFLLLMLERFALDKWLARHRRWALLYTLWAVWMGWVLFAHDSLPEAWAFAVRLYSFTPGMDWVFPLRGNAALLLVSVLCCVPPVTQSVWRVLKAHAALRAGLMLCALLLCVAGLVNAEYNPFLYFRF